MEKLFYRTNTLFNYYYLFLFEYDGKEKTKILKIMKEYAKGEE
jgi:hypothetical protein